jgi:SSS family solute:Na+ symporter
MAQNFWLAIIAWTVCFCVTILISLITKPRPDEEMVGLVYSLTPKLRESLGVWYLRPATLAIVVGVACVILNFIFY